MNIIPAGLILETIVCVLLAATIGYCAMLSRRLQAMRKGQDGLRAIVRQLNGATEQALVAIGRLKQISDESAQHLMSRVDEAKRLETELSVMLKSGNDIADRMSTLSATRDSTALREAQALREALAMREAQIAREAQALRDAEAAREAEVQREIEELRAAQAAREEELMREAQAMREAHAAREAQLKARVQAEREKIATQTAAHKPATATRLAPQPSRIREHKPALPGDVLERLRRAGNGGR